MYGDFPYIFRNEYLCIGIGLQTNPRLNIFFFVYGEVELKPRLKEGCGD